MDLVAGIGVVEAAQYTLGRSEAVRVPTRVSLLVKGASLLHDTPLTLPQ